MSGTERDRETPILVTGATGNVGRGVVGRLLDSGARVRALTRTPATARLPAAVDVVTGDLARPDTLARAVEGVGAVFLVWPFFAPDSAPAVVDLIGRHAQRVVYLSSAGGRGDRPGDDAVSFHGELERLLMRSGLEWTFLRPSGFATNTLMWAPQIRAGDVVRWPYADARRSLVHEADIAAVGARALLDDGHAGAAHVVTGPEALTQAEQVESIGEAIGRPLRFEEISRQEARSRLLETWGSAAFVDGALDAWARFVVEPELVTTTVEDVTGAPARSLSEWAVDHVADFAAPRRTTVAT